MAVPFSWLVFLLCAGELSPGIPLPYREAGLDERQAAVHLLNRLGFGPRPGQVEQVVDMGLEAWVQWQLEGPFDEERLHARLAGLPTTTMSDSEILKTFPNFGFVLKKAMAAGAVEQPIEKDRKAALSAARSFMADKGFRPQRELIGELIAQKIIRAVHGESQLKELLVDFWFNHFNVSITNNKARVFTPSFEKNAVRPFVLGRFEEMLEATAKHPAMLFYLDNGLSRSEAEATTTLEYRRSLRKPGRFRRNAPVNIGGKSRQRGINENYARELLELHTLGVGGGYSQQDVIEVARAFTGWTVHSRYRTGDLPKTDPTKWRHLGGVRDGFFVFNPARHDANPKVILGTQFGKGGGIEEGEKVLHLLAEHPATARFIATKFARRFVSDQPPEALVERLAQSFSQTDGDLKALVVTLVQAPEFWQAEFVAGKVKSPFELAVSAIRALDGEVENAKPLARWIRKMGQPLYAYQAPTGYPDSGRFWLNSGTLIHRLEFAAGLVSHRVKGVSLNLPPASGGLSDYFQALFLPPITGEAEEEMKEQMSQMFPDRGTSLAEQLLQSYGLEALPNPNKADKKRAMVFASLALGSPGFQMK